MIYGRGFPVQYGWPGSVGPGSMGSFSRNGRCRFIPRVTPVLPRTQIGPPISRRADFVTLCVSSTYDHRDGGI
jgi:hypothetical protein